MGSEISIAEMYFEGLFVLNFGDQLATVCILA
jgi:hypothetical protein